MEFLFCSFTFSLKAQYCTRGINPKTEIPIDKRRRISTSDGMSKRIKDTSSESSESNFFVGLCLLRFGLLSASSKRRKPCIVTFRKETPSMTSLAKHFWVHSHFQLRYGFCSLLVLAGPFGLRQRPRGRRPTEYRRRQRPESWGRSLYSIRRER